MTRPKRFLIILLALCLSSCSDESERTQKLEERVTELTKDVAELSGKIAELREYQQNDHWLLTNQVGILSESLSQLEKDVRFLKERVQTTVFLDPSVKGFTRIDTDNGSFFIAVEDVQSYLDGYKLLLKIGNPSLVTYSGFKLSLKWGRAEPVSIISALVSGTLGRRSSDIIPSPGTNAPPSEWNSYFEKCDRAHKNWEKSLHSKEVDLTDRLAPGTWNSVELVLSPAKSDELAYLKLNMKADSIWLQNPPSVTPNQ